MHTVAAGLSATGIAFGDGALWVASPVDGKVFRIDAATEEVRSFELGNAPVDVSVAPAGIWTAVTAAGGRTVEAAPKLEGLETLPAGTCDSAVYGGSGRPDALIVADLPMQAFDADATLAMVQAIAFVLRQHGFRAGPHNVALQACDDATVLEGSYTEEKCAANAKRYAATSSVVAVIGPFNSGCAEVQIPIANRAQPGTVAHRVADDVLRRLDAGGRGSAGRARPALPDGYSQLRPGISGRRRPGCRRRQPREAAWRTKRVRLPDRPRGSVRPRTSRCFREGSSTIGATRRDRLAELPRRVSSVRTEAPAHAGRRRLHRRAAGRAHRRPCAGPTEASSGETSW